MELQEAVVLEGLSCRMLEADERFVLKTLKRKVRKNVYFGWSDLRFVRKE